MEHTAENDALVETLTHALHSTETASGWYGAPECADVGAALAPHVMALLAQAWDKGYTSGHSNAMRRMSDEPNAPTTPNPHTLPSDECGEHFAAHPTRSHLTAICTLPANHDGDHDNVLTTRVLPPGVG